MMRRSLPAVLLFLLAAAAVSLPAQDTKTSGPATATRAEVQELRNEVAAQQQTIEELRAMVQQLMKQQPPGQPQFVNAAIIQSQPVDQAYDPLDIAQKASDKKAGELPLTAGWNGEHFFVKSPDGTFQIQPYGYVQTDYRAYRGDGAPPNTFVLRRARFGFQGNYGSHFQFALLADAAGTGAEIRDVYINAKVIPEFQIQAGQFKEPFGQEVALGVTNIDFVERGLQSMLYPSAASAYRSPGAVIHGDIYKGAIQYWVGGFNGKGFVTANTTNEPEVVGRLRFYPWRSRKDHILQGLAFGGAIARSRTRGLSNERTFNSANPDQAFVFFPTFAVNGPVWRYNGEFTFLRGPLGIRGEYDTVKYARNGLGDLESGGLGFFSAPQIKAQGWNLGATYLLTGEKKPENGTPRVKHPWLGPETPGGGPRGWGAWEVGVRYSGVQANEPGINFVNFLTPGNIPTFNQHTDQFTFGLNWYPNYWVRYSQEFNIDRLKQPSTIGIVPQNYFVTLGRLQFRF